MDRLVYIAGSGAKQVLEKQATTSNNLANATTTGFRAQIDSFMAVPVIGEGLPTRAFVVDSTSGSDLSDGPVMQTGRNLDVAVQGAGWIAVQAPDGSEAYTRHGSLKLSDNGLLQTHSGANVVGDSGPISMPPDSTISIAKDGSVSAISSSGAAVVSVVGRIKLVNPAGSMIERREDGLFKVKGGSVAEADPSVSLTDGALEGSNVNVVETMVEMQMKMIQTAESNAAKASQILSIS
jgi:flagellar basal-body rod protein FlgF